jgi:hypothetical protein
MFKPKSRNHFNGFTVTATLTYSTLGQSLTLFLAFRHYKTPWPPYMPIIPTTSLPDLVNHSMHFSAISVGAFPFIFYLWEDHIICIKFPTCSMVNMKVT